MPLSSFCLGQLLMDMGPSKVWLIYSVSHHWRILIFLLPMGYQWLIISLLGIGPYYFQYVDPVQIDPCAGLVHAATVSEFTYVSVLLCPDDTGCLAHTSESSYLSAFYFLQLFISLLEGSDFMKPFPLGLHVSKLLTLYVGLL